MRERSPKSIAELLRRNYLEHGISFYFFTDDNFARKKLWRETFEEIIKLRQDGIKVAFMMQVDLARKPKDFVRLAGRSGLHPGLYWDGERESSEPQGRR